jgi:hypothetical protein
LVGTKWMERRGFFRSGLQLASAKPGADIVSVSDRSVYQRTKVALNQNIRLCVYNESWC